MLTIFTVPKPFDGHIGLIQDNAIGSWNQLHPDVQVLLLGDEGGIRQAAERLGVRHIGGVRTNEWGTPLVDSVFERARAASDFPHMCFVNSDIILISDLLSALDAVSDRFHQFLIVGQRWDVNIRRPIHFGNGWQEGLADSLQRQGTLHTPAGSDYFVFPKDQYWGLPAFAIGRAGWDNWMIYAARRNRVPVLDATGSITAVHQDHDYSHLPDGQPHYRLPESLRNLRLGGGNHTVFTLRDATWEIVTGQLRRRSPGWGRAVEAELLVRLGPTALGSAAYAWFHPIKTLRRARGILLRVARRVLSRNLSTGGQR